MKHASQSAQLPTPARDAALAAASYPLGQHTLDRIGNTPLLRLERVARDLPGVTLLGKAEWTNPGGSVKDRAAKSMITEAQQRGALIPGKILLGSTSGNTGIAYAMIGAA